MSRGRGTRGYENDRDLLITKWLEERPFRPWKGDASRWGLVEFSDRTGSYVEQSFIEKTRLRRICDFDPYRIRFHFTYPCFVGQLFQLLSIMH